MEDVLLLYLIFLLPRTHSLQSNEPTQYLFEIDNPSERKIYRLAKRYAQRINRNSSTKYQFLASAFYPLEMVFDREGHTNLYFQEIPSKLLDDTGKQYFAFDLLKTLYPTTYPMVLQTIHMDQKVIKS